MADSEDRTPIMWCRTRIADVVRVGGQRASGNLVTKRHAVDYGGQVSWKQETTLRIHNRDGHIGQSDSHGDDPKPPKG